MATTGAADPWIITPRERTRYEEQFKTLKPINGIITGAQAKGYLLQSQLQPAILGQIWSLADTDSDGKMDINEFSIACKLINLKLRGFELPKTLPPSLLSAPSLSGLATATVLPQQQQQPQPHIRGAPPPMPPPPMGGIPRPMVPGFPPVGLAQPMAAGQPVNITQPVGMIPVVHPMTQQMTMPQQQPITSQPMAAIGPPLAAPPLAMAPPMAHPMATVAPIGIPPQPIGMAQPQPVPMAQPTPVAMAQPQPVSMPQPAPVVMAQPQAVSMAQPVPVAMAQPQAVSMAQVQPVMSQPTLSLDSPIAAMTAPGPIPSIGNGAAVIGQPAISTGPLIPSVTPANTASVAPIVPAPPSQEGTPQRSNSIASLESPVSVGSPPSALQSQDWAVPNPSRLKYTQLFNTNDRTRSGHLSGPQARNILVQSQIPHPVLAQIWNLSDIDRDGRLSCEEFVLAMHLCDLAKNGERMPATLAADLIPPSFRRQQRRGSVKSGVGGGAAGMAGGSAAAQPVGGVVDPMDSKDPNGLLQQASFEDKRKENFEKGQAELERRRKALLEIQRKEHEERERKEREEQEKRERIRQEQERRRQAEFEKQLQRQREQEEQREEERKRAQEQREAARREMERQRQLEWENQRSQELQSQRQKEQEKVLQLKAKNQNLTIELSQLNEKVKDLTGRISETRTGVTGVKSTIDGMRATRDSKLQEASALKARLKEQNQRLVALAAEKVRLEAKNKANLQAQGTGGDVIQTFTTDKQITLKQLRDRLDDMQKEIDGKMQDIENNNSQLNELKEQLSNLVEECENIYTVYEEKRNKVIDLKGGRIGDYSAWGDSGWNAGAAPADSWGAPADNWPAATATVPEAPPGFIRHRALYEFVARNADELSFQPGDTIMVPENHNAEPGWLAGELRGHTGWFPESYVEPIDPVVGNGDLGNVTAAVPEDALGGESLQVKRTLEGIQEVPENVSDSGSILESADIAAPPAAVDLGSPVVGQGEEVDFEAEALYRWQGTKPTHLSFNKGDIISVKEKQDNMCYGEMDGISGWFPSNAIKVSAAPAQVMITPQLSEEFYVALYPYQSAEQGDLSFLQQEVIRVIKKEGEWWTGVIGERTGIFPSNYVQKVQTEHQTIKTTTTATTTTTITTTTTTTTNKVEPVKEVETITTTPVAAAAPVESESKGKKPEVATVIAPYQATSAEQLNLQRGQLIMIRKKTVTGWWEGELQAKGKKRQIGWFPASYVKVLSGGRIGGSGGGVSPSPVAVTPEPQKEAPLQQQQQEEEEEEEEPVPEPEPEKPAAEPEPEPVNEPDEPMEDGVEQVIALYPYTAQNEDELTFERDEVITVLAREESSWWRGEVDGRSGLFPSNYVEPLSKQPSHLQQPFKLTSGEKKRQGYIYELINTEQAYIDDMSVVHDAFEKPLLESGIITQEEVQKIFVNWREIIVCNYMFLRALRVRREMSANGVIRMIGDILCENLPRMTAYIRFCSCQLSAAAYLQKLTEESPDFKSLTRKCQGDPRTKGMPLSSFLIKPMQRITKYPLLIRKILEYTPEGHPDRQNVQEALAKAEEFCMQVNEGVREKENSDRLEWLQTHVQCEGLEEPLTFNSLTNSLGPRKLMHFGLLSKAKSGKELVGFLMNDFLLLVQPSKPLGNTVQFSFERNQHVQFKLYKKPFFLNQIEMTKMSNPSGEMDLLLKTRDSKRCYQLTAPSVSERNLWLRHYEEAQKLFVEYEHSRLQRQMSKEAQFGARGRILVVVMEGHGLKSSSVRRRPPKGKLRLSVVQGTNIVINKSGGKCEPFCEVSMGSQEQRTPVGSGTVNPKWNATMQFLVKDLEEDVLCITVFDRGHFVPNEFLGRTEVCISDILTVSRGQSVGPITIKKHLHEVESGEILLKLDLQLFSQR